MAIVTAWQHIYSNVEADKSPKGQGGFQTLFYSNNGLTADEVSEMEGRLLYFPYKTGEPIKKVFFKTSTGKSIVAQIVVLPEPDQFGRKGRYLAHALAFSSEAIQELGADPFRVLRQFKFIKTVDEALQKGDSSTGDIPEISIDIPASLAQDTKQAQAWSQAEYIKLALLALRVDQQAQGRDAITLAGDTAVISDVLEAAFLVVPEALRPQCTFDTYFYKCNLVATYYWAIGFPEAPARTKFALINGESRQITGPSPTNPESSYERWAVQMIEAKKWNHIALSRNLAFATSEWLDGKPYDQTLLDAAPLELVEEIFSSHPVAVQSALRKRIGEVFPEDLIERVANHIYAQQSNTDVYKLLRSGFQKAELVEILYSCYDQQDFEAPPRDELRALGETLKTADHPTLTLFEAFWRNPRKQLPDALEKTDADSYRTFGAKALQLDLVKPLNLLVPGQSEPFLDVYLSHGIDDLVELVEALIDIEAIDSLARLVDYPAKEESGKSLKSLLRFIDENPKTPQSFKDAVEAAIEALPPPRGLKDIIGSVWSRLPGQK
ncbi:MAG: hypothetical protein AAF485_24670 [Chloroflexota bacterium]